MVGCARLLVYVDDEDTGKVRGGVAPWGIKPPAWGDCPACLVVSGVSILLALDAP